MNRIEQEAQFSLGRSTEINRDELKFQKFIYRLRTRFSHLFYDILRKQLILKGIITEDDWNSMKSNIAIDYVRDNHFTELRDAELLRERIQTLDSISNYVEIYYSKEWIQKNVLHLTDDDIEKMGQQIGGEGDNESEEEAPEEPQESTNIVSLPEVSKMNNEQFELDLLMKEKELEVLENITQVLKS
jgi:hypothetical protein